MDDFVCNKLTEWGLSNLIPTFKDEGFDQESFESLEDQEINNLIQKLGPRAKFKKRLKVYLSQQQHEGTAAQAQVLPSTSGMSNKRRRTHQDEQRNTQPPTKKPREGQHREAMILSKVKNIMKTTHERLQLEDETKLNAFLKSKISELETDKRELVGVFGKTGAGKSSLINAIIEKKDLLPSGRISACTTVMIKVEENTLNRKYEAEIEFITKEDWKDELWCHIIGDKANEEKNQDYYDTVKKLTAVYGEEWKNKSLENLMENKYFREIPESQSYKNKILSCETAKELSEKLIKYTRSDSDKEEIKRWYWPLVKCVTVRVPQNNLLQHVTLVDLPGNGDRNKSRNTMWKEIVGSCSTVWIVTDINRAEAENEAWEILESASGLMGNGGECQQIHFICTKSDLIEDPEDDSAAATRALLFSSNMKAKEEVRKEFNKLNSTKRHFSDDSFTVFTVSSKEFLKPKLLEADETEIPKLQKFLQNLNDRHSETLNYVSRAHGILSLIQGARSEEVPGNKRDACTVLEENMRQELEKVRQSMDESYSAFETRLSEGVEKSITSCEARLDVVISPKGQPGRGFYKILECVVKHGGVYKPKDKKLINLNLTLSSCLTDSIDEEFRKTFPNEGTRGAFNGVISVFSLHTEKLIEKYKDLELQLTFLKTEEEMMKTNLNKLIRERKKQIYTSLMETIEEFMQECYTKAAGLSGTGMLKNMRETITEHVHNKKITMFKEAKKIMLNHLRNLMEEILKTLENTLNEAIELSLKTEGYSVPDFSREFEQVNQHYKDLSSEEEMSQTE